MNIKRVSLIFILFLGLLAGSFYFQPDLKNATAMVKGNTLTLVNEKTDRIITTFPDLIIGKILGTFKNGSKFLVGAGKRTFNNEMFVQSYWDVYIIDVEAKTKKLIFKEAKTAQLSPDEKYIAVIDKASNLYIVDTNGDSKKIISSDVFFRLITS